LELLIKLIKKMAETTIFKFNQEMSKLEVTTKDVGVALLPMLNEALRELSPIVSGVATWVSENKDLVRGLGKGVLYISAATVAFGALQIAAGAAMVAMSPITVIAAGLGSIAFIVWDISNGFSEMGKDIKGAFSSLEAHMLTLKKMAGFLTKVYSLGLIDTGFGAKDQARLEELQRGSGIRTDENSKGFSTMISDFGKASLPGVSSVTGGDTTNNFYGGSSDIEKNVQNLLRQHEAKKQKKSKRLTVAATGA